MRCATSTLVSRSNWSKSSSRSSRYSENKEFFSFQKKELLFSERTLIWGTFLTSLLRVVFFFGKKREQKINERERDKKKKKKKTKKRRCLVLLRAQKKKGKKRQKKNSPSLLHI